MLFRQIAELFANYPGAVSEYSRPAKQKQMLLSVPMGVLSITYGFGDAKVVAILYHKGGSQITFQITEQDFCQGRPGSSMPGFDLHYAYERFSDLIGSAMPWPRTGSVFGCQSRYIVRTREVWREDGLLELDWDLYRLNGYGTPPEFINPFRLKNGRLDRRFWERYGKDVVLLDCIISKSKGKAYYLDATTANGKDERLIVITEELAGLPIGIYVSHQTRSFHPARAKQLLYQPVEGAVDLAAGIPVLN